MSRLENLLPVAIPCNNFVQSGAQFSGSTPDRAFTLSAFEKQVFDYCRGTYSIKEMAMMLYSKVDGFSFTHFYETIKRFADEGLLKNKDQVLSAIEESKDIKAPIVPSARTKEELIANLRKISLFANLPPETLTSIATAAEQKVYKPSEVIIKKDTIGDEVFVLLSGEIGVYASFYLAVKGVPLATLKPVTVFGESAAISGKQRTADVVATSDSLVLKFSLKKINDKTEGKDLNRNLKIRLVFQQLVRMHPVFKNLPGDILQLLLNSCTVEKMPPHKTVVQQGEKGQNFYFILSGSVNVIKDRLPEARLSVGTYFGEVGALLKQARTASIVTETESVFLVLSEKNFINLLATNMTLALAIEKEIISRSSVSAEKERPSMDDTQEITQNIQDLNVDDFSAMSFNEDSGIKEVQNNNNFLEVDFSKLTVDEE
jgi:cAMP-dependent protein kinase regulator